MGEVEEKIKWADLPDLGLSKDLSKIGLEQVIFFDFHEFKPTLKIKWEILENTLWKRAKELDAALCIKEINVTLPEKYEVWFSQKMMNENKWAEI